MEGPSETGVTFRGRPIAIPPGRTLLGALVDRSGLPLLQRSIRYHRPRAPFCGVGSCTGCLVRVNGVPNVRACQYRPRAGDEVRTENSWPSPAFDLLGVLDALFPRGLDTLHGFRRPAFATPLYQRVVRRLAGYGRLPERALAPPGPTERRSCDVVVVGGGPAGRTAAARVAAAGRSVLLLDRGELPAPPAGVEPRPFTTAVFLPPPSADGSPSFRLIAAAGTTGLSVTAPTVIVATGAYDANLLFTGNDRPGVMTADGALALRDRHGDPPFRRAVVFGGGARAAEMLERFGPRVAAVVAPGPVHGLIAERAAGLDIPVHPRTLLVAAVGRGRVRRVLLRRRGGAGETTRLRADAVVLAHRRLPNTPILFQAGVRMVWRAGGAAYYPEIAADLRTSVPSLFVAGEVAGFVEPAAVEASGVAAAEAALGGGARLADLPERVGTSTPHELEGYYREYLKGDSEPGKCVACACEDVLLEEVGEANARGYRGIEVIKRYTSLGTGLCQGRYCVPEALLVLAMLEGRPPGEVGYLTQRPPVLPTPLAALAELTELPDGAKA